jgi:hypothetical protein
MVTDLGLPIWGLKVKKKHLYSFSSATIFRQRVYTRRPSDFFMARNVVFEKNVEAIQDREKNKRKSFARSQRTKKIKIIYEIR